ncbi:MAG TPA: hypothetical protein VME19_02390, partial [Streptosporangiaceae bacterium]|nr:hypothetical protein [Streptosporangiaceae bacterium]
MRTSLTRAAAGAAVAAATVLALAGPAHAAPVPARTHATLSIVELKNVIRVGQDDKVSGRLVADKAGLAGRTVYLDRVDGKTLVQVQVQITGTEGGVAFTVHPGATARYELVYKGNSVYAPTHSGIVTVKVIPALVHTTLSIVESKTHIKAGGKDVVSGRLAADKAGLAGRTVYLDRVDGKTLVQVQVQITGTEGGVAFTVHPGA